MFETREKFRKKKISRAYGDRGGKNSNNNNKRRIKKNRKVNFLREGRMKFKQDMIFKNFKRISSQFNSTLLMFQPR